MNCLNCGALLPPDGGFCEQCGTAVAPPVALTRTPAPELTDEPPPALAPVVRAVLPGSPVLLGDGEVVWRQYEAVRLRRRSRGTGTLYVTDARVVFYAWAKGRGTQRDSRLMRQVKLEDITGLHAYVTRRLNFFLLALAAFFVLGFLGSLVTFALPLALLFGVFAAGTILLLFSGLAQRGNAGVTIRARGSDISEVTFGGLAGRHLFMEIFLVLVFPLRMFLKSYTAFDVEQGRPGEHSEALIAELGALIMDLQTRGALSSGHWAVNGNGAAGGQVARSAGVS